MSGFNQANLLSGRFGRMGWALVLACGLMLAGCGGGGQTEVNADPDGGGNNDGGGGTNDPYIGPTPETEDVQRFKIYFYDVFRADNRCGSCHNTGGQAPQFVREDNVNLAYAQALSVVDVGNPGASRVVEKVGGGHNCWIDNGNAVCAGDMQRAIERWTGGTSSETTAIELRAPQDHDITVTKQFPASPPGAFAAVNQLFQDYGCNGCHRSGVNNAQQPYFASADLVESYNASLSKMDIKDENRPVDQAQSRFVVRLWDERHNCGGDCADNAQDMLDAIQALARAVSSPQPVPSNWVTSKAMVLEADGILASGGGRVDTGAIATWDFSEGEGVLAGDSSDVQPRMNLTLFGDVTWVGGNGIQIKRGGRAQATTATSKKLSDQIKVTGEYSIEAWVAPANVVQEGPARIVTYSSGTGERNFTLGQTQYRYDFMNRSSTTNGNGEPSLTTDADDEDLQATLQHVVLTYSPVAGRRIYVNGIFTGDADAVDGGNINGWDDGFAFMLGSESSGARQWEGIIRYVSIYNRVLSDADILTNFDAGVGEKYYLMFNVTDLVDIDDGFGSYIVFETSVFDSYSYLFNQPFLYRVRANGTDPDAEQDSYNNIQVAGMRIGINGKEPNVGQAYAKMDTNLDSSLYGEMGQPLANIGTILPLERGSSLDEFFLTFEQIGDNEDARVEGTFSPVPPTAANAEPDIGLRNFAEINASMSKITGVLVTNSNVRATYNTVKQQLPGTSSVETFVSAQQMGVAQLAIEYCSELVDNTSLRGGFFPGFNFSANVATAFPASQNLIVDALFDKVAVGLDSQPGDVEMKAELRSLIGLLRARHAAGDAGDTQKIVKATCAAALGSAAVLVQ